VLTSTQSQPQTDTNESSPPRYAIAARLANIVIVIRLRLMVIGGGVIGPYTVEVLIAATSFDVCGRPVWRGAARMSVYITMIALPSWSSPSPLME